MNHMFGIRIKKNQFQELIENFTVFLNVLFKLNMDYTINL